MLRKGISLLGSDGIDLADRLEITHGAARPSETNAALQNRNFTSYAHIPIGQWRKTEPFEVPLAFNQDAHFNRKNSIRVFKVPVRIRELLEELEVRNAASLDEINRIIAPKTGTLAMLERELQTMIKGFEIPAPEKKSYIQGFFHSQPGLSTVTIDRNRQFVGLHIDYSVDRHKFYKIDTVNRLCINIGQSARYFQYVNQTVDDLEAMINQVQEHDFRSHYESRDLPGIVERFFEYYPDYAILKFRLEPYEAYIAPSDNMIHEGCSENMDSYDISLSLLGFLNTVEH